MKGSYSSRMLGNIHKDADKQNRPLNRPTSKHSSVRSGNNVIQQYANQTKNNMKRQSSLSPIQSFRQTVQNTIVEQNQTSYNTSRQFLSIPYQKQKHSIIVQQSNEQVQKIRREVEMMKSQIHEKDLQMSNIIDMHQSQIYSIVQKDHNEKTTLIKEINSKTAQILKMKQSYNLLNSQKQNMDIYLKQKETKIEQLENKVTMLENEKKEWQIMSSNIGESRDLINSFGTKFDEITAENKIRTKQLQKQLQGNKITINDLRQQINTLKQKNGQFYKQIKMYQQRQSQTIGNLEDELQRQKQKAIKHNKDLLKIPDLQMKLKQALLSSQQYQIRIVKLVQNNERMNVQLMNGSTTQRKMNDLQWQLGQIKKNLLQKQEQINKVRSQFQQNNQNQIIIQLNTQLSDVKHSLEVKIRQLEQHKSSNKQTEFFRLQRQKQIDRLQEQNNKLKERVLILDDMYKENRGLTTKLKQKIAVIEKLEMLINDYDHRLRVAGEQFTQRELETERVMSHTRELEGRCKSLEQMIHTTRQERQRDIQKQKLIQIAQKELVTNLKEQIAKVQQKKYQIESSYSTQKQQYEQKIKLIKKQQSELEESLSLEREKVIINQKKLDGVNEQIIHMNEQIVYRQQIIQTQNQNVSRLNKQLGVLRTQITIQNEELQKNSQWKGLYLDFMNQFSALGDEMTKNAQEINQIS